MNVTIGTQELAINSINDLCHAQSKLLEVFAESLVGTKERIRKDVELDILSHASGRFSNIKELTDWLDNMDRIEILGLSEEEIKDMAVRDALSMTDYESIEEMQDAIEAYQSALINIQDNINGIQATLDECI